MVAGGNLRRLNSTNLIDIETEVENFALAAWHELPTIAEALLILVVGWMCIGCLVRFLERKLLSWRIPQSISRNDGANTDDAHGMDPTIVRFLSTVLDAILKVVLVMTAAGLLGIQTTSFIAILAAGSLTIGLALQGQLTNMASGVMLIVFQYFKVGNKVDLANAGKCKGTVLEIGIFNTTLEDDDGNIVIVPNGMIHIMTIMKPPAPVVATEEKFLSFKAEPSAADAPSGALLEMRHT